MIYYAHRPLQFYKLTDLNVFIAHGSHRSHGSADASHGSRMTFYVSH